MISGIRVRWVGASSALLFSLAGMPTARAMAHDVPASHPFAFKEADVNVIILPYQYDGGGTTLAEVGSRLSMLVELESLRSILKFGSVGAVQIVCEPGRETECRAESVISKLLGKRKGAVAEIAKGHGIVMLSGRIYVEGESIWLQSYLRFLRRETSDDMTIMIGDRKLTGRLSAQSFALPPRRLTMGDLSEIENQYASARLVRSAPEDGAPARPLPNEARSRAFSVVGQQGAWIQVRAFDHSWEGWLKTEAALGDKSLERRLPEIAFIEGLAGYLEFCIDLERNRTDRLKSEAAAVKSAFARFEKWSGEVSDRVPEAVANQISGIMALLAPEPPIEALTFAHDAFAKAAAAVPYSAEAQNLEALAGIRLGLVIPLNARGAADKLTATIGLDPNSGAVLTNLESYYELLSSGSTLKVAEGQGFSQEEIARRLGAVKLVRNPPQSPPATAAPPPPPRNEGIGAENSNAKNLGPNPVIGGIPMTCGGADTIVMPNADLARIVQGAIYLDPSFFELPGMVQRFVYAHECIHSPPGVGSNEQALDCLVAKMGRQQGWLSLDGVALVEDYFATSARSWTHTPDTVRLQHLRECYISP